MLFGIEVFAAFPKLNVPHSRHHPSKGNIEKQLKHLWTFANVVDFPFCDLNGVVGSLGGQVLRRLSITGEDIEASEHRLSEDSFDLSSDL